MRHWYSLFTLKENFNANNVTQLIQDEKDKPKKIEKQKEVKKQIEKNHKKKLKKNK